MSRPNNRKGSTVRIRTAHANGTTLSTGGRKPGDKELLPGIIKATERGVNAGGTQPQKSEENIPSCSTGTAQNGHTGCVPSKTRSENAPMRDSSNSSTPQPISLGSAKGQYTDRFGHVYDIVDLTQIPNVILASSHNLILDARRQASLVTKREADSTQTGAQAQAPGGKADNESQTKPVPSPALTLAKVCLPFLVGRCEFGARCYRIHPPDGEVANYRAAAAKSRPKIDEICQKFLRDRRCFWGVLCDRIHQLPGGVISDGAITPLASEISAAVIPADNESHNRTFLVTSKHPGAGTTRIPSTSRDTVVRAPDPLVHHTAAVAVDPSVVCGDLLNIRNPKGHDSAPKTEYSAPSIKKKYDGAVTPHEQSKEPAATQKNVEDVNTPGAPVPMSEPEDASSSHVNVGGRRETEICHHNLKRRCRKGRSCSRLHPVNRTYETSSPIQLVHEESDSSDDETPDPEVDDGRGLFSPSLVTTDKPCINTPAKDRLHAKTGRRKKKKRIEEKSTTVPEIIVNDPYNIGVAQNDKQPLAVSISAATSTVVNLPSLRKGLNVSVETGDVKNCNESSFSADSRSSENSVISSDASTVVATSQSSCSPSNSGSESRRTRPICIDWSRGKCLRGLDCRFVHQNLKTNRVPAEPPGLPSKITPPFVQETNVPLHRIDCLRCTLGICSGFHAPKPLPPPRTSVALNGCSDGVQKKQTQERPALQPASAPPPPSSSPVRQPTFAMTVTVLEHTKAQVGPGFTIQDITTGFESRWVVLGNIQSTVTEKTIYRVLKTFGHVEDVRMPPTPGASSMTVKVLFSTSTEAMQAVGALNGAVLFDRLVSARLPVNNTGHGNGTLQDSSVKIEWDVPGKQGYAGYPSLAEAEAAVAVANGLTLRDSCIGASIYEGLPTLGAVNVRFVGLPPSTDVEDLHKFGQPEAVMLGRPNYSSLTLAVKGVQGLLDDFGQALAFEVFPPPYKDGMVRGLAHFSSPTVAKTASRYLNGRRPYFIGRGSLSARHVQTLSYTLPFDAYDKLASDIAWLRRSFWARGPGAALSVVDRRVERLHDSSLPVFIKLSGEDIRELGHLKSEFERLLHGEKVVQDGKVVWDGFFERPIGSAFLHELERKNPGVSIQKSIGRRTIKLFGPLWKRQYIRGIILDKIARIRSQQTRIIPLAGRLIGLFMSAELMDLQNKLGHENIVLNLVRRTLTVRGDGTAYDAVQRAVRDVQKRWIDGKRDNVVECPVCFNQVVSPIQLQCGHSWCRACFSNYLIAAIDNKLFPLTCLGNEATCSQPISVAVARDILTADDFDSLVNASFFAYVYSRPDEFHYCPTPDCPQIYRSAPSETILQCPSCLARICPSCHTESHDGMSCANRDVDGEKLFKEWMEAHDVKSCPGCKASIEKVAGCNHMTCTRCQTHICWVCLDTFPKAERIYDHMRAVHGGIGL